MSVRERISEIQRQLVSGDPSPGQAREMLVQLTALLANVLTEMREADADYATVLLTLLDREEVASRARIRAETSPEYARKREAADTKLFLVEMIRALKAAIRSSSDEMALTR